MNALKLRLLGLLTLLGLLLTACSGGSSTATAPASSTGGAVAAATFTPVREAPTATAAPSATAAATAPAPTATAIPTSVEVRGTADFVTWTQRALDLVKRSAPEWYDQVVRSIRVITSVPAGSGIFVQTKTFQVGNETAHAPGFNEAQQLIWYAGTIVHDSCHSRLYQEGKPHSGKAAEVACLTDQKAALLKFETSSYFSTYVQGLIDGADDPANQYWNNPNRHW
jgi:hypothetical protein